MLAGLITEIVCWQLEMELFPEKRLDFPFQW